MALPSASAKRSRLLHCLMMARLSVAGSLRESHNQGTRPFLLKILGRAVSLVLSHVKKWRCSIFSTSLSSLALRRLHSVISDRPLSGTEPGEATLRRLLASRAIGGYSLTSDDPAPGSLIVIQSSRVARLLDASKALKFVSLLSRSAVLTWIRKSSACFVLFLRMLTWKLGGNHLVGTLIQSHHRRRHYVGFHS